MEQDEILSKLSKMSTKVFDDASITPENITTKDDIKSRNFFNQKRTTPEVKKKFSDQSDLNDLSDVKDENAVEKNSKCQKQMRDLPLIVMPGNPENRKFFSNNISL